MPDFDAVVVGGGHNGLVCAGYLVKAGLKVLILEQRPIVGGCVATEEIFPGYKFNTGALEIIGIHGSSIGQDLELQKYGLDWIEIDPQVFAPFPDGKHVFFWKSVDKTVQSIEKVSKHDAQAYTQFVKKWSEINELMGMAMLIPPPPLDQLLTMAKGPEAEEAIRMLLTSARQILEETFETDYVRAPIALLGPGAAALSPSNMSTGFLAGWHSAFHLLGVKHPRGGNGMLPVALAKMIQAHGGTVRTNAIVRKIIVSDGTAWGVELADGTRVESKIVVTNTDPKQTFLKLIDPQHLPGDFIRRIESYRMANGITLRLDLAVSELPRYNAYPSDGPAECHMGPQLVCPSIDYLEKAYDEYKFGNPPEKPALWISSPSVADPGLAPPGKHVVVVETRYSPHDLAGGRSWEEIKEAEGRKTLDLISEYAPNIHRSIVHMRIESPADISKRLMLTKADHYHGHMTIDQSFSFRPALGYAAYRSPVKNHYITGAGTHPGGSVTGFPGYNAAHVILEDLGAGG